MRHTLHVAVLLLYCVAVFVSAAEHRCIYDEISRTGPRATAVVLELPTRERGMMQALTASVSEWETIRFRVFTDDLNDPSKYCTAEGETRPNFAGGMSVCKQEDILTTEKKSILLGYILPRAIKLHADRLLVRPFTGSTTVPEFPRGSACGEFTIPESHRTVGLDEADMFLYVSAGPTQAPTAAWATACLVLSDGRPIMGVTNYGPSSIAYSDYGVRVLAHEIGHALGFDFATFTRKKMVETSHNVRGKDLVLVVGSPKTLEKTREHFGCATAPGMELEDEGGAGAQHSHWKRRNAKDELMSGVSGFGFYTALTMAAFEDTGFYKAKWGMEELMAWGNNSGCALLTEKCLTNGITLYPEMFCNSTSNVLLCTSDRTAMGRCYLQLYNESLPPQYQYFADPRLGSLSNSFMDYCPCIEPTMYSRCIDGANSGMPGSRIGPRSRCLKGDGLHFLNENVGDVCAEVSCENGTVSVRYLDDDKWHECPEGGSITPVGSFTAGRIMCPRHIDVCYEPKWERGGGTHGHSGSDSSDLSRSHSVPSLFIFAANFLVFFVLVP